MSDYSEAELRQKASESIRDKLIGRELTDVEEELLIYQTELEMQNQELRETQERTEQLNRQLNWFYNHAQVAYLSVDHGGKIKICNETLAAWTGIPVFELKHKYIFDLFYEADQLLLRNIFRVLLKRPDSHQMELKLKNDAGTSERVVMVQGIASEATPPVLDGDGFLSFTLSDITEHVRVRSTLDLASQVLQSTSECVIITDANTTILDVNKAFCEITGYSKEEVIGRKPSILSSGKQNRTFYERMWTDLNNSGHWRGRITNRKKSGETYIEELAIHPVYEHGAPVYYIGIFYDVSERMAAEEMVQRAQRLESVGTLVGGIAHNFNNMLAGISGNLYLVNRQPELTDKTQEKLQRIQMLTDSASEMIRQLMAFSRQTPKKLTVVELNEFVRQFQLLHSAAIASNIEFELDLSEEQAWVKCDRVELEQVLLNLLINASHALRGIEAPRINIAISSDLDEVNLDSGASEKYNLIAIHDNGCGIPNELLDKVFEPFFTTKEQGEGTGLGLSTAYGSVAAMGGHIQLISTEGKGTSFHISLPAYKEMKPQRDSLEIRQQSNVSTDGAVILIADDNEMLCEVMSDILQDHDYKVITVNNGKEALHTFTEQHVSLLLTDAVMPEMGGFELASAIHKENSQLPIVVMSGYSSEFVDPIVDDPFIWRIDKPFVPEQALQLIQQCLQQKADDISMREE